MARPAADDGGVMEYGRAVRGEWGLDPDFLTLNHGSYGATPLVVRAAQDEWRVRLEAQPTRFFRAIYPAIGYPARRSSSRITRRNVDSNGSRLRSTKSRSA